MRINRLASLLAVAALVASCQQPTRRGALDAPPATRGEVLYVGDDVGRIHAVGKDGVERWVYGFGDELEREKPGATRDLDVVEIATATNGAVVALLTSETGETAGTAYLVAVSAEGAPLWHRAVAAPSSASR